MNPTQASSEMIDPVETIETGFTVIPKIVNFTYIQKQNKHKIRNGENNTCSMCGITGHYTRDCENDENFKQEVSDGCWTFWYCDYCGREFFEESEHTSHVKDCSCYK